MMEYPLPWAIRDRVVVDATGKCVSGLVPSRMDDGNAAYIVQCVNSHEALVEALTDSQEALQYTWFHTHASDVCDEEAVGTLAYLERLMKKNKAALALAEGKTS